MDKLSLEFMQRFSKKFEEAYAERLARENIFQRNERKTKKSYAKCKQNIPWYLYPFREVINNMLYQSFKDGKAEYGASDTVKIKRPEYYSPIEKKGEEE
jgi:hypothetical protein